MENSIMTKIPGLKTRTVQKQKRSNGEIGGKRFISDRVMRIITNLVYKGIVRYYDKQYSGQQPPLISEKVWKEANDALVTQKATKKSVADRNKYEVLLKGILRCGHCGGFLTPKPGGRKLADGSTRVYMKCTSVEKVGKSSKCPLRSIPATPSEELVVYAIGEIGKHPEGC